MAHGHLAGSLEARRAVNRSRMWAALGLNVAMLAATLIGGILTSSLALVAEAGHLISDVGAIAVGLLAARLASLAPSPARTYGFQRTEILGALVNGVSLVAIAALIVVQGISRLSNPSDVAGAGVLALGGVALVGNLAATAILASGSRTDINLEAVLRHSAGDAVSSLGVIVAGLVVLVTGWNTIDPLISLLIAILIAFSSWRLLKEPIEVLMESAPADIDVRQLGSAMASDPEVLEVHDLHVWTVTSGFPALSSHLVVRPGSDRDLVRARIERLLQERFAIRHTTLQVVEANRSGDLIAVEDVRPAK